MFLQTYGYNRDGEVTYLQLIAFITRVINWFIDLTRGKIKHIKYMANKVCVQQLKLDFINVYSYRRKKYVCVFR